TAGDGPGPEILIRRVSGARAPRVGGELAGDQHRHIAARAVALLRDVEQGMDHVAAELRAERVNLRRVGPGREVWIASVSEDDLACLGRIAEKMVRLRFKLGFSPVQEE